MSNEITINQARRMKRKLEDELTETIHGFENLSGLSVGLVKLVLERTLGGRSTKVHAVEVEVNVNV